jgi:hypothetical protein
VILRLAEMLGNSTSHDVENLERGFGSAKAALFSLRRALPL